MDSNIDPLEQTKIIIKQAFPDDKTLENNIDGIMEFIWAGKIAWKAEEKSKKLSIDFLNEADRDIKSYRILYLKKIYPHAIYHFQQAVEKAMKGYCLGLGILSIEEIKGHDIPYVLLKGIFEKTGMKGMLQSSNVESKSLLDKVWEAKDDRAIRLKIARMPFEQIIHELNNIDNDRQKIEQICGSLIRLAVDIKINSETLPLEFTTLPAMASLYRLGSMSFPHEAFTRYPDDEKMIPTKYGPKLGIVKASPMMTNYLIKALKELKRVLA
ncbi:hypothetical protein ES703_27864 [subsurface metagenome]